MHDKRCLFAPHGRHDRHEKDDGQPQGPLPRIPTTPAPTAYDIYFYCDVATNEVIVAFAPPCTSIRRPQ